MSAPTEAYEAMRAWNDEHPVGTVVWYDGAPYKTWGMAWVDLHGDVRVRLAGSLCQPRLSELSLEEPRQLALI